MDAVKAFAADGGPVVGICNGFQVLTESGLLPGALQKNAGLKFLCQPARLRVEAAGTALTTDVAPGTELTIPINHFEGNYTCGPETLAELRADERIVFRYVGNPNGSTDDIAGVCSEGRNVVGLMPHPERASHALLGLDRRPAAAAVAARGGRCADRLAGAELLAGRRREVDITPARAGRPAVGGLRERGWIA